MKLPESDGGRRAAFKNYLAQHPVLSAGLIFSGLTIFFFRHALQADFMVRDIFHEYFPLLHFRREAGFFFPRWNPYVGLGCPLAGTVFPGRWYPLHLILFSILPLSVDFSLRFFVLFHFALAGTAVFYFLSRLGCRNESAAAGAVTYTFSGYLVSQHYAVNLLAGFALLPLAAGLLAAARRENRFRHCILAGLAAGLVLLGGDPQGFGVALGIPAAAFFLLAPEETAAGMNQAMPALKRPLAIILFFLTALLVASPELWPLLTVWKESGRAEGFDFATATCWSFHPLRLPEFFLARPFGDPWPLNRYWGDFLADECFPWPLCLSPYLGVFPLVAAVQALFGRRRIGGGMVVFFAALLVIFLGLAAGRYSLLYKFLFEQIPGFRSFRYPEKYLLVVSFAMSGLTAWGSELMIPGSGGRGKEEIFFRRRSRFFSLFQKEGAGRGREAAGMPLAWPMIVLLLSLGFWTCFRLARAEVIALAASLLPVSGSGVSAAAAAEDLIRAIFAFGFFLALTLLVRESLRWVQKGYLAYAPAALVFFDLLRVNPSLAPAAAGLYTMNPELGREILRREGGAKAGSFRLFRDPYIPSPPETTYEELRRWERDTLKPNLAMSDGIEYFVGLNVAMPRRLQWMTSRILTFDALPVFNVKYAIVSLSRKPPLSADLVPLRDFRGAALLEFKNVFPRAYLVRACRVVQNDQELAVLFPATDFSSTVLLEPPPGTRLHDQPPLPGDRLLPLHIGIYRPDRVQLEFSAPYEGWVVLNDLHFPGWTADLDGKNAPIFRANGLVRAVRVSPGPHRLTFIYR